MAAVAKVTGELAGIAPAAARDGEAVLRNTRKAVRAATGRRRAPLRQAADQLATAIGQARQLAGPAAGCAA